MAEQTGISWCDHTFNPWIGCTALSPACDGCYAEARAKRWGEDFAERRRTTPENWRKPFAWDRKAAEAGVRRRVFILSLGDFWDNKVDPVWRMEALGVIRQTLNLDWLILTKRPQNIRAMLVEALTRSRQEQRRVLADWLEAWLHGKPPANVWLGTTTENQVEADRRIPHLRDIPARVRFLSCEPLLEEINPDLTGINWVICGGESGPGARQMDPQWARELRFQCEMADVPFFFKQWGEWSPDGRVGTKRAGDRLDGRQHHEWPA